MKICPYPSKTSNVELLRASLVVLDNLPLFLQKLFLLNIISRYMHVRDWERQIGFVTLNRLSPSRGEGWGRAIRCHKSS